MGESLVEAVRNALRAVRDPATGRDVVEAGMVQGLTARNGLVQFALAVPRERAREMEPLREAAERAAAGVPGVLSATVVLTDAEGNDMIAIRSVQYFCLGFDHRLIDGADSGKFMSTFKNILENWDRPIG